MAVTDDSDITAWVCAVEIQTGVVDSVAAIIYFSVEAATQDIRGVTACVFVDCHTGGVHSCGVINDIVSGVEAKTGDIADITGGCVVTNSVGLDTDGIH